MNIAIVCYPTFGGSGIVATELGLQLVAMHHKVHFISYEQPVRLDFFNPKIFFHEINSFDYPLFNNTIPYESMMTSKLVDVVLNENIDLIHVHYAIPHASVAYMVKEILKSKGKHVPYITTLHGTDITLIGKDKAFLPIVEFSINQSDVITAVSNFLKEETLVNFNIIKPIEVIYNFIDTKKVQEDMATNCCNFFKENNEKLLVHVSNFRKVKRIEDIIYGFELVQNQLNAKLLLVGDGPERSFIENIVRQKKLTTQVKFLGKHSNVTPILSASDLFIFASEYESFGLSALEAMACGLPVISTNTGGLPELNINNQTGFTFNLGDYPTMAAHIIKLLTDDNLYNLFKKNALNQAKKFDVANIIPQYMNIYNKLLK